MDIVPFTLAISLSLVLTFIVFFLREQARGRLSSAERDSLLPLADEARRPATTAHQSHDTECGCRDGSRPPCPGCLKPR